MILLTTMPRSFLVRTGFCRGHRIAAESAAVGELTWNATELKPVEHPGDGWAAFRDNLPIDFTIRSGDEEKNSTSRFVISVNGMYFDLDPTYNLARR